MIRPMISWLKKEKWFLAAVVFMFFLGRGLAHAEEYVDVALVLVQDVSGSMDQRELDLVRLAHAEAFRDAEVLRAIGLGAIGRIAVSYVTFRDDAHVQIGWRIIDGEATAVDFSYEVEALDIQFRKGQTNIAAALDVAHGLLQALPYVATRQVVDVVGDGKQNIQYRNGLNPARAELVAAGVQINGLVLTDDPSDRDIGQYYEEVVAGGPGGFVKAVHDSADMKAELVRKLILEIY